MNEESRDNFQELMKLRHNGWKPYHMAQIDGREVELISYPFWRGNIWLRLIAIGCSAEFADKCYEIGMKQGPTKESR